MSMYEFMVKNIEQPLEVQGDYIRVDPDNSTVEVQKYGNGGAVCILPQHSLLYIMKIS